MLYIIIFILCIHICTCVLNLHIYIYTDPVTCFFFLIILYLNFSLYANDTVGGVVMVEVFMCVW